MKIFNETRKYYIPFNQALRGIENCAFAWVVQGETVRDLTLAESIAKRNEQAKNAEPLPYAEIPGVTFRLKATESDVRQHLHFELIRQAHEFCANAVSPDFVFRLMREDFSVAAKVGEPVTVSRSAQVNGGVPISEARRHETPFIIPVSA